MVGYMMMNKSDISRPMSAGPDDWLLPLSVKPERLPLPSLVHREPIRHPLFVRLGAVSPTPLCGMAETWTSARGCLAAWTTHEASG